MSELSEYVILDEIQHVPQLLSYIKMEVDKDRKPEKFLLAGSQQFSMMKGMSETIAGRIALLNFFPCSWSELLNAGLLKGETTEDYLIFSCLNGLYPELCTNTLIDSKTWYSSYVQTYIEKDIKSIYNIGDLRTFGQFLRLLAARCSQQLNLSALSNEVGLSVGTIKNWISILEAGKIIYLLQPYYNNFGKRLIKSPRVYWYDNGLVCYLTGHSTKEQVLHGLIDWPLFENLVIGETLKLFNNYGIQDKLFYLRTSNGQEVDLIIESGNKVYPIEIKLTRNPKARMFQQIENLKKLFPKINWQTSNLVCTLEESFNISSNSRIVNLGQYIAFIKSLKHN